MLEIKEIQDKEFWENSLLNFKEKTFLNSWNWGEFNKLLGNKVWHLGVFQDNKLEALALTIKIKAKRGTFLFVPHGPNILKNESKDTIKELFKFLIKLAKVEKVDFIRIAPILERVPENIEIFKSLNFREAPLHIHPEATWELNIEAPLEKILGGMRKTTRYLIRKAEKDKSFRTFEKNDLKGLELFYKIYLETKERHKFVPFSFDYLKKEFLAFSNDNQISILLCAFNQEIVSGGIFIFWQERAYYHHGASSKKYLNLPTSYLLLWEAIKLAKQKNCKIFNFWGIAEDHSSSHPWRGLTFFKQGFGGEKKEYVKTQDFPLTFKYWLNYIVERVRKIKRRY